MISNRLGLIRNLYWRLRSLRPHQSADRRRLYRWIAEEKKALLALGVDAEELRLWCRSLSCPRNGSLRARLLRYRADKCAMGLALSLPERVVSPCEPPGSKA